MRGWVLDALVLVNHVGATIRVVIPWRKPLVGERVALQVGRRVKLFVANSADIGGGSGVDSFGVLLKKRRG